MHILILDEVIRPDVVGLGCRQACWALTVLPSAFGALHLQAGTLPQPMHALAINRAFAPQQRPDASIAVARMRLGQRRHLRSHRVIHDGTRLIAEARTLELHQDASALHRKAMRDQNAYCRASFRDTHAFSPADL